MADYFLSAVEVKEMTGWPDPLVDDWLEIVKNVNELLQDTSSVRGSVSSLGVATGLGFTSAKAGTGIYTVTFDVEKASADYVVLPIAGTQDHVCTYENKAATGFGVRITSAATLSDSDFNFMVKE